MMDIKAIRPRKSLEEQLCKRSISNSDIDTSYLGKDPMTLLSCIGAKSLYSYIATRIGTTAALSAKLSPRTYLFWSRNKRILLSRSFWRSWKRSVGWPLFRSCSSYTSFLSWLAGGWDLDRLKKLLTSSGRVCFGLCKLLGICREICVLLCTRGKTNGSCWEVIAVIRGMNTSITWLSDSKRTAILTWCYL